MSFFIPMIEDETRRSAPPRDDDDDERPEPEWDDFADCYENHE
jgi:hypothetical protein